MSDEPATALENAASPKILRGQFPLWVLLFVLPTACAMVCVTYFTTEEEARQREPLLQQAALARQEFAAATERRDRIQKFNASLDQKLLEWRSPERVLKMVQAEPPEGTNRGSDDYYMLNDVENDSIHFFLQASDDDLRCVVAQLIEEYPKANSLVQSRTNDFFRNLPNYIPRRMDVVREPIKAFQENQRLNRD